MRSRTTLGLSVGLTLLGALLTRGGLAQSPERSATRRQDAVSRASELTPYTTRDLRTYTAQKEAYRRPTTTPPPVDKRARAAVFAKGVKDYYPSARANQSKNSNVIDPRTLCVPGRHALLQR